MSSIRRPEHKAPPDIFYNEEESRKYTQKTHLAIKVDGVLYDESHNLRSGALKLVHHLWKSGTNIQGIISSNFSVDNSQLSSMLEILQREDFHDDPNVPMLTNDIRPDSIHVSDIHDFNPERHGFKAFSYKPVTHVIFDLDGTLLDTVDIYFKAMDPILDNYGKKSSLDFLMAVNGRRSEDIVMEAIRFYDLPMTPQEFSTEYRKSLPELLSNAEWISGAKTLITHLNRCGIPIAIATSSEKSSFELKTKNHESILDMFDHVINGSHELLKKGKPAPDIFLLSAESFPDKPDPAQCLVFEDAPSGVIAAKEAGMQSVMIPHEKLNAEETKDATQLLSSLSEFRPQDFGLPPFPVE